MQSYGIDQGVLLMQKKPSYFEGNILKYRACRLVKPFQGQKHTGLIWRLC